MSAVPDGQPDPTPVRDGAETLRRLEELGLALPPLEASLLAGDVSARNAGPFHPVNAAGTLRWLDTVESLRRQLADNDYGWKADDVRNSPRTVSPDGRTAIMVAGGNRHTGRDEDGVDPQTARARGESTRRAVQINGQLALPLGVLADASAERRAGVNTWVLLYHRSDNPQQLRAELSLPVDITAKGFVTGWRERLLLPDQDFGPDVQARDADDGMGDDGVEVRVGIR